MRRRCCCNQKKCLAVITVYGKNSATCEIMFNGGLSSSSDANCPITSWLWDFGDGTTSNQQNPTHKFGPPNRDRTITLTIRTSCGCEATTTLIIPESEFQCPEPFPNCPVTSLQSLPEHWLATFADMPAKAITLAVASFQCQGKPPVDPSNRYICTTPAGVSYYAVHDYTPLNRSYEVPGSVAAQAWETGRIIVLQPYWTTITVTQCLIEQSIRNSQPMIAKITIGTTFTCNSRGTNGALSCEIEVDLGVFYIGRWFRNYTLPPGQLLKDQGPIVLPPVAFPWSGGADGFSSAIFAYSDPCGFPATGAAPTSYPTCTLTPNG